MSSNNLAVLILTHNEEKNIEKCLRSLSPLTQRIYVVDSGSTDRTREICEQFGVTVMERKWTTYAEQFNWGLDHCDFGSDWIMRMDADEELTPELVAQLQAFLRAPASDVSGVLVRRRVYFMGRWIKHGGYYPTWLLRVFRKGIGRCEALWMDEHIVVSQGRVIQIAADVIDQNNKDLTFWIDKHNRYATREVFDLLAKEKQGFEGNTISGQLSGNQIESKRWLKANVYNKAPLFLRALVYFLFRYFIQMGFRDGKEGLIFHVLQGFWYRFLVDAKLFEHSRVQHDAQTAAPTDAKSENLAR